MNSAMIIMAALIATSYATIQPYAVRGFFKCGDKPLTDSQVILYTEHTLIPDDVMARDRTGPDGSFSLSGEANDYNLISNMQPRLRLYHSCDQGNILPHPCDREIKFDLPTLNQYFVKGAWFEFGTFNVQAKPHSQSTACIKPSIGAALTGAGSNRTADWLSTPTPAPVTVPTSTVVPVTPTPTTAPNTTPTTVPTTTPTTAPTTTPTTVPTTTNTTAPAPPPLPSTTPAMASTNSSAA